MSNTLSFVTIPLIKIIFHILSASRDGNELIRTSNLSRSIQLNWIDNIKPLSSLVAILRLDESFVNDDGTISANNHCFKFGKFNVPRNTNGSFWIKNDFWIMILSQERILAYEGNLGNPCVDVGRLRPCTITTLCNSMSRMDFAFNICVCMYCEKFSHLFSFISSFNLVLIWNSRRTV